MADGVDVSDRTARKKDPEFDFVIPLSSYCSLNRPLPLGSILRMNALQPLFPSWRALCWLVVVYAIPFLGEMHGVSSVDLPDPAAGMRKPLRFRQISLAMPQLLFRTLALGNLTAQFFISLSQFCRSLRDSHFKLIASSRNPRP